MHRDRSPSADSPPPWEALEALAAGELPHDEARALRRRLEIEPTWQAAWQRIESVEELLRREPLLALPLSLVHDTLRRIDTARILPLEREKPWRVFARVAAAVLVFCASWFAFSGQAPAFADVGPRPEMSARLPALTAEVPAVLAVEPAAGPALALAAGGLLLMVLGVVLGMRWHARATQTGAQA